MDHLEHPTEVEWEQRREWFEGIFDINNQIGGYQFGEHATGLLVDLQAVYCAGAYISTLVVACAIADSHLRETEFPHNFPGGMKLAFSQSVYSENLDWLRLRRNELVHFSSHRALAISVDDQWTKRASHEADAKRAIEIIASLLFEKPWV
jgi:hypothetical protein